MIWTNATFLSSPAFVTIHESELEFVDLCGLKFVQTRGDLIVARGL